MMLNKVGTFLIGFLLLFFSSCQELPEEQSVVESIETISPTNMEWLQGVWIDSTSFKVIGQTYVESWKMITQDSLIGLKYAIKNGENGDTTNLKMDRKEGLFYLSVGQGKDKSIFMEQGSTEEVVKFSNTKDEFPYSINYTYNKDSLLISVSGNLNGEVKYIEYKTLRK